MDLQEIEATVDLEYGQPPRSSGLHLSTVLAEIARRIGVLKPRAGDDDDGLLRMALGVSWERYFASQRGDLLFHPGEFIRNGVAGTPDAISFDSSGAKIVEEFKVTWKSSRKPVESQWLWWHQLRCYCYVQGTPHGRLWVYYVNGDYRGSGPQFRCWQATFSREDLEASWAMVVNFKDRVKPEGTE